MNADDELDGLKKIRPVDAPPFLYTRIHARIDALTESPAPVQWIWTFAAGAILVLLLNVGVLVSSSTSTPEVNAVTVVNAMQLSTSNDFYHE